MNPVGKFMGSIGVGSPPSPRDPVSALLVPNKAKAMIAMIAKFMHVYSTEYLSGTNLSTKVASVLLDPHLKITPLYVILVVGSVLSSVT